MNTESIKTLKPRSIAMITDDFLPAGTGVGIHVQKMSREMVARGHRVIVITTRRKGQKPLETWEGVKVYRIFSIPVYGFYQALPFKRTLQKIFLQNSISIVHCHYLSIMMLSVMRLAKKMGIPTILTTHMTVDHLTQPVLLRPLRPLLSQVIARIYEKFGHLICVSNEYAKQVERFSIASKVHYITNPIDFDDVNVPSERTSGQFSVLFAGRLNPEKNVGLLLRAFKILLEKNGSAQLWIAGQGGQEKELKELTKALAITNNVKFLGHVAHNQLPALYVASDVFVLPSTVETQGLVALEAMRFKRPVIVTNRIISARELVDDGKNGFIVDADNPQELADKLDQLRVSPELRQSQGNAGFEKTAIYTVDAVSDALEEIYLSIGNALTQQFDVPDFNLNKRLQCAFCQVGSFDRRAEHMIVSSNVKHFKEEYFAVWRCAFCRSIHSYARFALEDYRARLPFPKRKLNPFNRVLFEKFYQWMLKHDITPESKILFYGVNGGLFKEFLTEKEYRHFDIFENVMNKEQLISQTPGAYDAVMVFDFLEQTEEPRMVFEFAKRQLVPGGLLVVHTPNAECIRLPLSGTHQLHQPYRVHIASKLAIESLAEAYEFTKISIENRHAHDTLVPFINYRAFHDLPFFWDGSLESAITFKPKDIFRKPWRIPRFFYLAFFGGIFKEPSNLTAVFKKTIKE